jgi:tRNA A-37 threonylcarbamoyl transferase component Bud32
VPRLATSAFAAVIDHLQADAPRLFHVSTVRCEVLSTRSGQFGTVARVAVEGTPRPTVIFVKVFASVDNTLAERARQLRYLRAEFDRTTIAARAFAATPALGVARPIACFPDLLAIVTEEARGVGLHVLLRRLALGRTRAALDAATTAMRRAGEWVRRFQEAVPVADPTFKKDYRAYLDDRLRTLAATPLFMDTERQRLLAFFDEMSSRIPAADWSPVAVHADFCPPNILVRDDGLTVLDLAMSTDRTKYLDVAHLYMHLALSKRRLLLPQRVIDTLQHALLDGFQRGVSADAPLFRLMLLQHVACHLAGIAERALTLPAPLRRWMFGRAAARGLALAGLSR